MKEGEGSEWRPGSLKTRGMHLRVKYLLGYFVLLQGIEYISNFYSLPEYIF